MQKIARGRLKPQKTSGVRQVEACRSVAGKIGNPPATAAAHGAAAQPPVYQEASHSVGEQRGGGVEDYGLTAAADGLHAIIHHQRLPQTLPAAGNRNGTSVNNAGSNGNYWSATHNNANNAYNVNFNGSNFNPDNNNNRNNGFSVRLVQDSASGSDLLTDLYAAYYDARRHKRNTHSQLAFEIELERNMQELYDELRERRYKPGSSVCFIVRDPVQREVFASSFRDRVVHHLYFNYVSPMFERAFIYDSYSCRKGKGTSMGIDRLESQMRRCTRNYTRQAWVMKLDIRGYFMSIDRERLYKAVTGLLEAYWHRRAAESTLRYGQRLDKELLLWLTDVIVHKDPLAHCRRKGSPREWEGLPDSKSLFCQPEGRGLPIGDLTSQLFSNVFLNGLDHYVKRSLRIRYYGRYVDDFYMIDPDPARLRAARHAVARYLDGFGLRLHPAKVVLQPCTYGIQFLGAVLRPFRRYCRPRTVRQYRRALHRCRLAFAAHLAQPMPSAAGLCPKALNPVAGLCPKALNPAAGNGVKRHAATSDVVANYAATGNDSTYHASAGDGAANYAATGNGSTYHVSAGDVVANYAATGNNKTACKETLCPVAAGCRTGGNGVNHYAATGDVVISNGTVAISGIATGEKSHREVSVCDRMKRGEEPCCRVSAEEFAVRWKSMDSLISYIGYMGHFKAFGLLRPALSLHATAYPLVRCQHTARDLVSASWCLS